MISAKAEEEILMMPQTVGNHLICHTPRTEAHLDALGMCNETEKYGLMENHIIEVLG